MIETASQWLLERVLRHAGGPPIEIRLWNGVVRRETDGSPRFVVTIHDARTLLALLINPLLCFGEAYSSGRLEVSGDLVAFLKTLYRSGAASTPPPRSLRRLLFTLQSRPRRNTPRGSRHNIHQHYDLGNDFYGRWLDAERQYTCAYFPDPACDLDRAQIEKMDYVCRKLRLVPGDRVVEAGCGWGGLALYMARRYAVRVHAYNISREQVAFARARARALGVEDRVTFVEDDYRNIAGEYDAFVSVGMLEHVGPEHYRRLGAVIDRVLTPEGRGLIHSIGRNARDRMNPWIERRIFPGAHPPSLREMMEIFQPRGLSVLDVENLRPHYARTLEHWLDRFEGHSDWVADTYDDCFVRTWRLYLAGSVAAFDTGALQLFQVTFSRARNNTIPWTRSYLYLANPPTEVNTADVNVA